MGLGSCFNVHFLYELKLNCTSGVWIIVIMNAFGNKIASLALHWPVPGLHKNYDLISQVRKHVVRICLNINKRLADLWNFEWLQLNCFHFKKVAFFKAWWWYCHQYRLTCCQLLSFSRRMASKNFHCRLNIVDYSVICSILSLPKHPFRIIFVVGYICFDLVLNYFILVFLHRTINQIVQKILQ